MAYLSCLTSFSPSGENADVGDSRDKKMGTYLWGIDDWPYGQKNVCVNQYRVLAWSMPAYLHVNQDTEKRREN